jgi:DNA-binding MarR family transcriptional regulator
MGESDQMSRRPTVKRSRLIEELMLEARRGGSLGTLHNRAAADLAGINATDWECLDVLDWTGPITAGELARRVGITSGAATGAIDRLESLGLVIRDADPKDRRKVIVRLVDAEAVGFPDQHRLVERFAVLAGEIAEINDRFDDDQLEAIVEWLRESNNAVERSIERMRDKR